MPLPAPQLSLPPILVKDAADRDTSVEVRWIVAVGRGR